MLVKNINYLGNKEVKEVRSLVYVPNTFCNLGCRYCYLGRQTDRKNETNDIVDNFVETVNFFAKEGIVIDNFILHGAEITAMNKNDLKDLLETITYYGEFFKSEIQTLGTNRSLIHIKTNLYNFDKIEDILDKNQVSVSGSFDLPISLHKKYRVTKNGKDTSLKIIDNIKELQEYKHPIHLSCVVTKEVFDNKEEFANDIVNLENITGHDMVNKFYIMFAYDSDAAIEKFDNNLDNATMLTGEQQVEFYNYLKERFKDTKYMKGIKYNWFKEFLPTYCTFRDNCSDSLLIQKNGDVYPCHRAQPRKDFYFGNIFKDSYKDIRTKGFNTIQDREQELDMKLECFTCPYFTYCKMGCTLVRKENNLPDSYTCSLQKELYKDNPERFPPLEGLEVDKARYAFIANNNLNKLIENIDTKPYLETDETHKPNNYISNILKNDDVLNKAFDLGMIRVEVDNKIHDTITLKLDVLIPGSIDIYHDSVVKLHVNEELFKLGCLDRDLVNNNLHMMFLRNTKVVYGPEQRTKQEHIFNQDIYYNQALNYTKDGYCVIDISNYIHNNSYMFKDGVHNIMYITTKEIKKHHYVKQAENAFYHIQAINLPFSRLSFNYNRRKNEV